MKNGTPLFGSCDVKNLHAAVARSAFSSQYVQNTPASDHFLKVSRRKMSRRCEARSTFPSQNVKNMWHEAHLQAKMYKAPVFRTTFEGSDVEKVSDRRDR